VFKAVDIRRRFSQLHQSGNELQNAREAIEKARRHVSVPSDS